VVSQPPWQLVPALPWQEMLADANPGLPCACADTATQPLPLPPPPEPRAQAFAPGAEAPTAASWWRLHWVPLLPWQDAAAWAPPLPALAWAEVAAQPEPVRPEPWPVALALAAPPPAPAALCAR
jgi:hypothetical protein